jgi:hypothetical protein
MTLLFHLLKEHSRPFRTDWIKGHQDDTTPYDNLSRDAQLNVDVDHLATAYRDSGKSSRAILRHYKPTHVSVSVHRIRLPGKIEEAIRYHVNGTALKHYIIQKKTNGCRSLHLASTGTPLDYTAASFVLLPRSST